MAGHVPVCHDLGARARGHRRRGGRLVENPQHFSAKRFPAGSASRQNSRILARQASAPICVETTGMPLAKASSSLTRTPEPLRTGHTNTA